MGPSLPTCVSPSSAWCAACGEAIIAGDRQSKMVATAGTAVRGSLLCPIRTCCGSVKKDAPWDPWAQLSIMSLHSRSQQWSITLDHVQRVPFAAVARSGSHTFLLVPQPFALQFVLCFRVAVPAKLARCLSVCFDRKGFGALAFVCLLSIRWVIRAVFPERLVQSAFRHCRPQDVAVHTVAPQQIRHR